MTDHIQKIREARAVIETHEAAITEARNNFRAALKEANQAGISYSQMQNALGVSRQYLQRIATEQ